MTHTDGTGRHEPYRITGRGSDLVIDVTGASAEQCLVAAVQGFAAALGETDAAAELRSLPVTMPGDAPADLLVGVIDEAILHLDTSGLLAVDLIDVQVTDHDVRATLLAVDLAHVAVHGAAPKAATWHGARLEPVGGRWEGHVMLDL